MRTVFLIQWPVKRLMRQKWVFLEDLREAFESREDAERLATRVDGRKPDSIVRLTEGHGPLHECHTAYIAHQPMWRVIGVPFIAVSIPKATN